MNDIDLDLHVVGVIAGDANAFARWVAGAEPMLRRGLRPFAAFVDTEAVLQEGLLRVWQTASRFAPDGKANALLRFASRVTKNLAIDELRRGRRLEAREFDDLERALERDDLEREAARPDPLLRQSIEACREQLPDKPALALAERLKNAGAEPDDALAERLNMRLNTFLQNFTRARKFLAECLKKRGIETSFGVP